MRNALIIAALVGLGAAPLIIAGDASASSRKSQGSVTACSTLGGFDCYTARVEQSRVGKKLVLRGGTRIDCGPDCRDTLRRSTVDFWQDRMLNGG